MAVIAAGRVASILVRLLLPFLPLDKFKAQIAPLLALGATLNPINVINWAIILLTTLFFYFFNPFGVSNVPGETPTRKHWWTAFKKSFWVLIPLFFIYWLVIHYVLKYAI